MIMINLGIFVGCLLGHSHLIRFFLVNILMQLVERWKVGSFCLEKVWTKTSFTC